MDREFRLFLRIAGIIIHAGDIQVLNGTVLFDNIQNRRIDDDSNLGIANR